MEMLPPYATIASTESFPYVIFGPQIVEGETHAKCKVRNDWDLQAWKHCKIGEGDIKQIAVQLARCNMVVELRNAMDSHVGREGESIDNNPPDWTAQDNTDDLVYEGAILIQTPIIGLTGLHQIISYLLPGSRNQCHKTADRHRNGS